MTKYLYLSTALFISASQQCHAMEAQNIIPANILATITAIKEPESVVCLLDSIAILGKDGCGLYDFSGKEIIRLQDYFIDTNLQRMSAHPNKKTLAIRRDDYLTVYDITTKEKIYQNNQGNCFGKPIFSLIDDTILIGDHFQNIRSLHYKNNTDNLYLQYTSMPYGGKMLAFHPTKQEFLLSRNYNDGIYIFQIGKDPLIKKTKVQGSRYSCQYSPDGSLIAVNNGNGCFIYPESDLENSFNFELDSKYKLGELSNDLRTAGMVFHPTSFILATFSSPLTTISYWNTQTLQRITTTALNEINDISPLSERIDFSSDGKSIVIALYDKCLVVEVPFKLLSGKAYELGTKDKCSFTLWVLKNYLHEDGMLPKDITDLLIHNILQSAQLSISHEQHCCKKMYFSLLRDNTAYEYVPKYREYYCTLSDGQKLCIYCPYCGKKLPDSLRTEYFDTLAEEYGIELIHLLSKDKDVPKEFLSDKWWKQRGL